MAAAAAAADAVEYCQICYNTLTEDAAVEYQTFPDADWERALFCRDCVEVLRTTQFDKYCKDLATTKCARETKTLLQRGPPVRVYDRIGFPSAGNQEVYQLRLAATHAVCRCHGGLCIMLLVPGNSGETRRCVRRRSTPSFMGRA